MCSPKIPRAITWWGRGQAKVLRGYDGHATSERRQCRRSTPAAMVWLGLITLGVGGEGGGFPACRCLLVHRWYCRSLGTSPGLRAYHLGRGLGDSTIGLNSGGSAGKECQPVLHMYVKSKGQGRKQWSRPTHNARVLTVTHTVFVARDLRTR